MKAGAPGWSISVADTAKWVAMYRALESERQDAIFHDPYARRLAGEQGARILEQMPHARQFGWPMIVRTAVLDELIGRAIQHDAVDLVVNLAAGLDARPYRMDVPASLRWVEVDYPKTIEEKSQALAGQTPRCQLERIKADLADGPVRRAVLAQIAGLGARALFITEGLMIYLTREQAGELAQDLAAAKNAQFWVTDVVAPFILKFMERSWSRQLAPGTAFRFAPQEGAQFFEPYGWELVEYRSMVLEARRLHRESPMAWLWSLLYPRAIRQEASKRSGPMTGMLLLARGR